MSDTGKKRRLEEYLEDENVESKAGEVTENRGMPFTCICFEGRFYTTDEDGFFLHRDSATNKIRLYRTEVNEMKDVEFVFIRNLSEEEALRLENIEDVNVHDDLTKNNRSLYY